MKAPKKKLTTAEKRRREYNRVCGEVAMAKRHSRFLAICKEHKETPHMIRWRGTSWYPACEKCANEKALKRFTAKHEDKAELERRRNNRRLLARAIKEGASRVFLVCKHHGRQIFEVYAGESTCQECRRASRRRQYHKRKERADALVDSSRSEHGDPVGEEIKTSTDG